MNRIHYRHHVRRIAAVLGGLAASVLVALTGATAALAYPVPPQGGPARCSRPGCTPSSPGACPAGRSRSSRPAPRYLPPPWP